MMIEGIVLYVSVISICVYYLIDHWHKRKHEYRMKELEVNDE